MGPSFLYSAFLTLISVCFCQAFQCNPLRPRCIETLSAKSGCNILSMTCRQQLASSNGMETAKISKSSPKKGKKCDYPKLWLIPSKIDTSCTRNGIPKVLKIREQDIEIHPKTIKLPGCFVVKVSGTITDASNKLPDSYMVKAAYKWWDLKEFSDLKCQNVSKNGCGGFGNNCVYCDVCQSLDNLSEVVDDLELTKSQQRILNQFKNVKCPKGVGDFSIVKKFCFRDWRALDTDGDCQLDFLSGVLGDLGGYKSALQSLNQLGFGTIVSSFKLAHNATDSQVVKEKRKELEIERRVRNKLRKSKARWDENNGPFEAFQDWCIQYLKDYWHRKVYLPFLLATNEVACLKVTFDVCDKRPTYFRSAASGNQNERSLVCP